MEDNKNNKKLSSLSLSQIIDSNSETSIHDHFYSDEYSNKNILRGKKEKDNFKKYEPFGANNTSDELKKQYSIQNTLNDIIEEEQTNIPDKNFRKKWSVQVTEQHVKSEFELNTELENEYFLNGNNYDTYLSKLKSENIKEYETGRETFVKDFLLHHFLKKMAKL